MNQFESTEKSVAVPAQSPDPKPPWVKPEVTTEKVQDVTQNFGGLGGDAGTCHS
jgi:hypothetical protein